MSPELLDPERFGFEKCRRTRESDCYALGMVILEVLSGQAPFPRDNPLIVMRRVIDGNRPGRPQGAGRAWFTDDLWETLELCWSPQPSSRPAVEVVLACLERGSTAWRPLPPSVNVDVETDTEDEFSLTVSGPGTFPHSILNHGLTFKGKASRPQTQPPQLSVISSTSSLARESSGMFSVGSTGARKDGVEPNHTKPSQPSSRRTDTNLGTPGPRRKGLQFLPRSEPVEEEDETNSGSADRSEGEGGDGALPVMSEAEANKKIAEDINEFFSIRNIDESEGYFVKLPLEYRHLLVDKMVSKAIESKEADGRLVADAFARAAEKQLCPISAFEEGFLPTAGLLDDVAVDAPKAFRIVATVMKGAGLDKDEERWTRIAQKLTGSHKLLDLLS